MAFTQEDTPEQIFAYGLSEYLYNAAMPHRQGDKLLSLLCATPVYLSHVSNPISGSVHISQRAVGVLLHKLGVRPTP